jgi:hypothetical protein
MKKCFIFLTVMFLLACNNGNDSKTSSGSEVTFRDLDSENLKGDISSYEETAYKTDSTGKIGEMDSCCATTTDYDENGNAGKSVSKDSKGTVSSEAVLTRHSNGLFKSVANTAKGKSTGGFETRLDDKGKVNWAEATDSNGKLDVYYTDITQNEVGEVTGWKQFDKDSVFRQSGENKYEGHRFLENTTKDSVGKVKSSNMAGYNEKGEQIESSNTTVIKDSTTTKVIKYTYETHDDMGNWTQRTTWDDKGKATAIAKRTYTYRKK